MLSKTIDSDYQNAESTYLGELGSDNRGDENDQCWIGLRDDINGASSEDIIYLYGFEYGNDCTILGSVLGLNINDQQM